MCTGANGVASQIIKGEGGGGHVYTEDDDWTVVTRDGKLSAQFEHTVAVTATGVEVLTLRPGEALRLS